MKVQVHRTYFQMLSPAALRAAPAPDGWGAHLAHLDACPPHFYRYLYGEVGRQYNWRDRLTWPDEKIIGHLADPAISLYVLYANDVPAGYFEMRRHDEGDAGSIEIVYFGLMPHVIGRGLGKHMLTLACQQAWAMKPGRVWLHTCSLDHPAAIRNYAARGFEVYKEEDYEQEVP